MLYSNLSITRTLVQSSECERFKIQYPVVIHVSDKGRLSVQLYIPWHKAVHVLCLEMPSRGPPEKTKSAHAVLLD